MTTKSKVWKHPELKNGEILLINVKNGERFSKPSFVKSLRIGKVAYTTEGLDVVPEMKPLFGLLKKSKLKNTSDLRLFRGHLETILEIFQKEEAFAKKDSNYIVALERQTQSETTILIQKLLDNLIDAREGN